MKNSRLGGGVRFGWVVVVAFVALAGAIPGIAQTTVPGEADALREELRAMKAEYEHQLWREHGEQALKLGGHGGMDYIMNYRLVHTIRAGLPPDLNVYDAAAWSAPGPLSEISVAWESMSLTFPDFTRGNWRQKGAMPLA